MVFTFSSMIAAISSIVLTIVIILFSRIPAAQQSKILLVNADSFEEEDAILEIIAESCRYFDVKSRNLTKNHLDLAIEVRVKKEGELLKKLMQVPHVVSASLVSHDGEVTL